MKIGLVCGYGVALTPEVKMYLNEVAKAVKNEGLAALIISEGFTQRMTHPTTPGATVMENYLLLRLGGRIAILPDEKLGAWDAAYALPEGRTIFIHLDEDAYTTIDNIVNAADFLFSHRLLNPAASLTIFCNTQKEWAIKRLTRHFFPHTFTTTHPVSWKLGVSRITQMGVNFYTLFAMRSSRLARIYRESRIKHFSTQ